MQAPSVTCCLTGTTAVDSTSPPLVSYPNERGVVCETSFLESGGRERTRVKFTIVPRKREVAGDVVVVKESRTSQVPTSRILDAKEGGGLDSTTMHRLLGGQGNFVGGKNKRPPLVKWLRGAWTRHFASPSKTLTGPEPYT